MGSGMMVEEQVMDYYDYDERPLEISVANSSYVENLDDEDTEDYETALEGTFFRSNRDDTNLFDDLPDEDERLQEKSNMESEKISFSFLSGIGIEGSNTTTEIPAVLNDNVVVGSAISKDASSLSKASEPLTSSEAAVAASEFRCGRPQRGPSALREHYSITHFFEVNVYFCSFR